MTSDHRGMLPVAARVAAIICAVAAAILALYTGGLLYAAATFKGDSLPGPTVLYMVAVGVGLGAVLFGGLGHVLWRRAGRRAKRRGSD